MTFYFRRPDMAVDPPPRIEEPGFGIAVAMFMPAMSTLAVGRMRIMTVFAMVVQVMAFHIHAAMEIAVGLMDHRT